MQQLADLDVQADRGDIRPSRKRKASARRKVTVRLSEGVCGRLDVLEAALEHFLNPAPSVEALMRERLDDMHARFDHLERDMRVIAETVALHARYHLAVMPPVPESRQREAVVLGDERFKVLAEQVDRRVREGRPLMQETIDRLNSAQQEESDQATGERPTHNSTPALKESSAAPERLNLEQTPPASAKAGRRSPGFSQHEKNTGDRTDANDPKQASRQAANFWPHL
jgi:hypothetical protein